MTTDLADLTTEEVATEDLPETVGREVPVDGEVTIAVVDPDEVIRNVLYDHITNLNLYAEAFESVSSLAAARGRHEPTVVLLGPSVAPEEAIERVEPLIKSRPEYGAVMLVFELAAEVVRSAFLAGIDDVVAVDGNDSELIGAVTRSVSRVLSALESDQRPSILTPTPTATPASAGAGRVVTVFGAKGGMGKSVLAINLAVSLAQQSSDPVVLVDANFQFGDVAIMLQLRPEHTITEAVLAGDRLDWELLEGILLRHKPSGLLVLAAPPDPVSADRIGRSDLLNILAVLREHCAYVVVDTSPRIEESTLEALEAADDILMLANLDVMSLKNSRLGLQTLQALGIGLSKVKLVLNRANAQDGLSRKDAERAMQLKVDAALPTEALVAESVNRGVPVMLGAPTSKFAMCVEGLARSLKTGSAPAALPRQSQQPQPALR